jgi:hypothetical protein
MDNQTDKQSKAGVKEKHDGPVKKERVPEGSYLGIEAATLHQYRWPLTPFKNIRLPLIPMEYLVSFTNKLPGPWHKNLYKVAQAELQRRSSDPALKRITFTEHVFERFTQLFPTIVSKTQKICKKKYGIGAITIMKLLFLKALDSKDSKQTAKSDNNFRVQRGLFKWTYGIYEKPKGSKFYKIISVYPSKNQKKHGIPVTESVPDKENLQGSQDIEFGQ